MYMDIETAKLVVETCLKSSENELNSFGSGLPDYENQNIELVILEDLTQEHDFGWVFFYNSKTYLESGDFRDTLAGNVPLIVDRKRGQIHITGTAHDIDFYIKNFKENGDPNKSAKNKNI